MGFLLGIGFSLDPSVIRDTARVLAASLAFGAIVVASAGLLMLAFSSLSKNSRYVAAMWLGFWLVSSVTAGVLENTVGAEWCPLASYTNNINRIRDALPRRRAGLGPAGEPRRDGPARGPQPHGHGTVRAGTADPGRRGFVDAVRARGVRVGAPAEVPVLVGAGRLSLAVVGLRAGRPGGGVRAGAGDAGPGARSATMRPRAGYRLQMTNDK